MSAFEYDVDWNLIPAHMQQAMRRYVEQRYPVGDFLMAMLRNDLRDAVARADDRNIARLPDYVHFLTWYCPASCWGSPEKVSKWLAEAESVRRDAGELAATLGGEE